MTIALYLSIIIFNLFLIIVSDILKGQWVQFWLPSALEVGSPMVTSAAYDDLVECPLYER